MSSGVDLPPLKAWIVARLRAAGVFGIEGDVLWARLTAVHPRLKARTALKAHVWQINERLRPHGLRIVVTRGCDPVYFLRRDSGSGDGD